MWKFDVFRKVSHVYFFCKSEEETFCEVVSPPDRIHEPPPSINDSVTALTKDVNEVITINESQSTEFKRHIFNSKIRVVSSKMKNSSSINCEDCNEVKVLL